MLKCRICGGELRFLNEKYTCLNCGADFSLKQIYENIDVCLCNIDSEENGGRTVASHLSAEIYTLLETHKIKTYYSRVAAADLFGEALERANISAISSARVIILVGTKPAEFEVLSNKYRLLFENKIVVPVFKGMDAKYLPKSISGVQGVDYSRVGASTDLVKGVLNALDRGDEYDYATVSAKNRKLKLVLGLVIVSALVLVITIALAMIFLNPKDKTKNEIKEQETTEDATEATLSAEDLYFAAKAFADGNQYADAIAAYGEIAEYKDSQKQINLLYQKYAGYYTDENTNIDTHLKVTSSNVANIEITYYMQDGRICQIGKTVLLSGTSGSFEFVDSENNSGNASFSLTNDEVQLQIKTTEKTAEIFFPDSEIIFPLTEKKDAPMRKITLERLISLVKTRTLISDLDRRGIETTTLGPDSIWSTLNVYEIVNTDIFLFALWGQEPYIYAIQAPVDILEGTDLAGITEVTKADDVFFLPGGLYGTDSSCVGIFTKVSTNDGKDIVYWDVPNGLDGYFGGTDN